LVSSSRDRAKSTANGRATRKKKIRLHVPAVAGKKGKCKKKTPGNAYGTSPPGLPLKEEKKRKN